MNTERGLPLIAWDELNMAEHIADEVADDEACYNLFIDRHTSTNEFELAFFHGHSFVLFIIEKVGITDIFCIDLLFGRFSYLLRFEFCCFSMSATLKANLP